MGIRQRGCVGITIIWTQTTTSDNVNFTTSVVETDVLFNSNVAWDSYRGPLQNTTSDLRRVALHEFGHVLGLNHPDLASPPQSVAAVMNSVASGIDDLTADDVAGGTYLYGGQPQIITPPATQTVDQGNTATFSFAVAALGPQTYQWYKNGNPISGATSSTLSIANVQPSDAATYTVKVANSLGNVTSSSGGVLTVLADVSPSFTLSPTSLTVKTGRSAVFNAIATGTPAPTLQWKLNGSTTIPGAGITTDPILLISGATSADAGTYTCTATNTTGTATATATLAVSSALADGYLNNVSALGYVATGGGIIIGGFNIVGPGFKKVLVRGIGPGLNSTFGLTGYVADPYLELFTGNNPITISGTPVQNDNWGTPDFPSASSGATISTTMATLGAYTLQPGSLDAVLLINLSAGGCTAQVSGINGGTGTGVVEIYDADSLAPATRLNNLSARDLVLTGQNILIGGFNIGGGSPETVLIRAIGPGLNSTFGLTGILAQPVLTLFNSNRQVISSNTAWGGDAVLTNVQASVGAYPLVSSSADSLLLFTLPPGGYTAQVTGLGATTGIAVVEIYELY